MLEKLILPMHWTIRPLLIVLASIGSFATLATPPTVDAADLNEVRELFSAGNYDAAALIAKQEVERGIWNERWPRILIECHLATGRYREALAVYEQAVQRYPTSLTLRMLGLDAFRFNGQTNEALQAKAQIMRLMESSPSRYASRDNLVAAGRYFAMRGEDGRQILQLFYDRVLDADPNFLEGYLATAELALNKGDFKVAADTLAKAELVGSTDPRVPAMASKAWANSDAEKATLFLNESLKRNPRHARR